MLLSKTKVVLATDAEPPTWAHNSSNLAYHLRRVPHVFQDLQGDTRVKKIVVKGQMMGISRFMLDFHASRPGPSLRQMTPSITRFNCVDYCSG